MSAQGFERCSHLKLVISKSTCFTGTWCGRDLHRKMMLYPIFGRPALGRKECILILTYIYDMYNVYVFFPWDPYIFICTYMKTHRNQPNLGQYIVRPMDPMLFCQVATGGMLQSKSLNWKHSQSNDRGQMDNLNQHEPTMPFEILGMRLIEIETPLIPDFSFLTLTNLCWNLSFCLVRIEERKYWLFIRKLSNSKVTR